MKLDLKDERYANADSIIDLANGNSTLYEPWLELPSRDALREALSDGVANTITRFAKNSIASDAVRRNIYSCARGAWQVMCPLRPDSCILDFGCGLGAISRSLARRSGRIIGVDACYERLLINQAVNAEEGISNIRLVCGTHEALNQLESNSIDGIVLNGVLEWLPTHVPGRPRSIQVDFLKTCRRILKNDGWIYIGIENRWSFQYFTGRPDDHTNLLFGSLLPRFCADIYSRVMRRKPYRTYTYGPRGTAKLLEDAGMKRICTYALVPDYRRFDIIMPLDGDPSEAFVSKRFGITKRWKRKVAESRHFFRRFAPCLGVIGYPTTESLPDWLQNPPDGCHRVNHVYVKSDRASIWYDRAEGPSIIREVSLSDEMDVTLRAIADLSNALSGGLDCPLSLRDCCLQGCDGFVWLDRPLVTGQVLSDINVEERDTYLQIVLDAIIQVHKKADGINSRAIGIRDYFDSIAINAEGSIPKALHIRLRSALNRLERNIPKRRILMHGDSKPANIVITVDRAELIDWEWSRLVDFPGYDVLKLHWSANENPNGPDALGDYHIVERYLEDSEAKMSCKFVHPNVDWRDCVLLYWMIRIARSIRLLDESGAPVVAIMRAIEPSINSVCRVMCVE